MAGSSTTSTPDSPGSPGSPPRIERNSSTSQNGTREADVLAALAEADRAAKRRRWPLVLVGAVVGGAGTLAAINYLDRTDAAGDDVGQTVTLAAAAVGTQDLVEEIEWTGTLGYGEAVDVSGLQGTVTSAAPLGASIERGDIIATVDAQPVVALFGDTPMWRTLAEGDEGRDVMQLETNLAALGYDPDETVDIDRTFTANTEAMVERWQEDLGIEPTGLVELGSVIIVEGPSSVVVAAEVGGSASGLLATVASRAAYSDVVAALDGVITSPAAIGATIEHGSVLYEIEEVPVIAIVDLDPISSILTGENFTTLELEESLAANGYDPDDEMTVDGVSTAATEAAIARWQNDAGLPTTSSPLSGGYALVPSGRTVEQHLVEDGRWITGGGPILIASESRLSVDLSVDVAEADEFEVGQPVTIELADETSAAGTVIAISSVRQAEQGANPTVDITIDVIAEPGQDLIEGPVTVVSVGDRIDGATVVPTRALISLAEGGFAVEKLAADGSTTLVGIELGTFDDGVVEVVAGDLGPGDEVVVPQ